MLLDVQLADGLSFDLFTPGHGHLPAIFATAYDEFVLEAFKANAIDYVLKPVSDEALARAFAGYRRLKSHFAPTWPGSPPSWPAAPGREPRQRILARSGAGFVSLRLERRRLVRLGRQGRPGPSAATAGATASTPSLAELEAELDPQRFFRINRQVIVAATAVRGFRPSGKGRLELQLVPAATATVSVTPERAAAFRDWLGVVTRAPGGATGPVDSRSFPPLRRSAMPLFWKPYTSDVTAFIDQLKTARPTSRTSSGAAARCSGTGRSTATPRPSTARRRCRSSLRLPDAAALSVAHEGIRGRRGRAGSPRRDAADAVDGIAVARLYGEPLFALPNDLYIPPDALEVFLEAFEGPLDLLLYLIRKQNFNILDIPMASVTRQYLPTSSRSADQPRARERLPADGGDADRDQVADAAAAAKTADGKEAEDPRAELVRRLVEYEQMKLGGARLDALPLLGRDFLRAQVAVDDTSRRRLPDVVAADLREAWADLMRRASLVQHHRISREQLSVREHMSICCAA
jgi:segregation and condensation protein A